MPPKITVISPSIRPRGLELTFKTLQAQTFKEFEWLPRLSIPGPKPDLCKQFNQALRESKGELIVFLQDYIDIPRDGLERMWQRYLEDPKAAWTAPVGKVPMGWRGETEVKWDWRPYWKHREHINFDHWEIDWGSIPRIYFTGLRGELFDERYDDGFGWENVDLAYRLHKNGVEFRVDPDNKAIAYDHDAFEKHPYKHKPNMELWAKRKEMIDLAYASVDMEGENEPQGSP